MPTEQTQAQETVTLWRVEGVDDAPLTAWMDDEEAARAEVEGIQREVIGASVEAVSADFIPASSLERFAERVAGELDEQARTEDGTVLRCKRDNELDLIGFYEGRAQGFRAAARLIRDYTSERCEKCKGTGTLPDPPEAADKPTFRTCDACHGSGHPSPNQEEN